MSWYEKHGPDQDIVISTRVRLARNVSGYAFPHLLDARKTGLLIEHIIEKVKLLDPVSFHVLRQDDLNDLDKQALAERHMINPQLIKTRKEKAILINQEEDLSLLLMDEDHIRIQSLRAGFQPDTAFDQAKKLAIALESVLDIAHDQEFGYLTSCPTNVGTGLRVSALLHVPGLNHQGNLKIIIDSLRRSGYTVRGYYGEGSQDQEQMIQISNQITLGQTDQSIVNKFKTMLNLLINEERKARRAWFDQDGLYLKDQICRADAILKNACLLDYKEAFHCLSLLRLGRALNFDGFPDYPEILKLSYLIGVASIQKLNGKMMNSRERDSYRAELIKTQFSDKK